ncbi:MAG: YdcF family protein [Selenomonadaceae bacterium]
MIYLLKFGASFVLPPGIFFVAFTVLAVYCWRKRQKKIAGYILAVTFIFYLFSTSLMSEYFLGRLESVYEPPTNPQGDVIIMLGGGAMQDTPDVDGIGTLCGSPANRLLTAVRLQKKLQVPILLTGGQVYRDSGKEAAISKRILVSLGVEEKDILIEDKSLNTRQNAEFSSRILREYGLTQPILVTSAFHMERAVLNFTKENVKVVPYPSDYMVNRTHVFHYTKLMAQSGALVGNVMVLQEKLRTFVTRYFE